MRMTKNLLCLMTVVLCLASASAFEPIHYDLASMPKAPNTKIIGMKKNTIFHDGMLSLKGGMLGFDLNVDKPCRLSFLYKNPGYDLDRSGKPYSGGFWRIMVGGEGEKTTYIYSPKNEGLIFTTSQFPHGGKIYMSGGGFAGGQIGPDAPWSLFELDVAEEDTTAYINGNLMVCYPSTLLPLRRLEFMPWRLRMDVKDFKVVPLTKRERKETEKPIFSLDFEGGFDAENSKGQKIAPTVNTACRLAEGVHGKALKRPEDSSKLSYPVENLFKNIRGTVMYWGKVDPAIKGNPSVFTACDGKKVKMSAGMARYFPGICVAQKGIDKMKEFSRETGQMNDAWYHFALCWDEGVPARFFVNGSPLTAGFGCNRGGTLPNADLETVKELVFGRKSGVVVDDIKIYDRALSNAEIAKEYRSGMPIDLVLEDAVIASGVPSTISVLAAPGGYYQRPNPTPKLPLVKAKVSLEFTLFDADGKKVAEDKHENIEVDKKTVVKLKPVTLPVGVYNLVCVVKHASGQCARAFKVYCEKPIQKVAKLEPSNDEWEIGKRFMNVRFDDPKKFKWIVGKPEIKKTPIGSYMEMGNNKHDSVCMEIKFPKEMLGKSCVMEFVWPDDKPRMTGLIMYRRGGGNRDRLGHIINSGGEYPESGKMRTTRYTFLPGVEEYLFELRTGGTNYPAALAEMNIYELDQNYPVLKIRKPEGLPGRQFGHYDEDQTFDQNLCYDTDISEMEYATRTPYVTEMLLKYMNYVGMTAIDYPMFRYRFGYDVVEGSTESSMYPYGKGVLRYVLDSFAANGKKFFGEINPNEIPQLYEADFTDNDYKKRGMFLKDCYGNDAWKGKRLRPNPAHPEVQKLLLDNYRNLLDNYANNPALAGLVISEALDNWGGIQFGYDDWTMKKFTSDTKIPVPRDYRDRCLFLNSEKRKEWLAWRAKQVTNKFAAYRKLVDEYNPNLKLYVLTAVSDEAYENSGIDGKAILSIKGFESALHRTVSGYRWFMHRGAPESEENFKEFDYNNPKFKYLRDNGGLGLLHAWETYYETRYTPPDKKYACYFQAPNGKPVGRYYLKELAFDVGAMDTRNIMIGGQPLSPHGVEKETREFAKAFCALPELPFLQAGGIDDPAVVRYCSTKNGTYFYAVNMSFFPIVIDLGFEESGFLGLGEAEFEDLSTGETLSGGKIELLPFQLRSFLSKDKNLKFGTVSLVGRSPQAEEFFKKRLDRLVRAANVLEKKKINCDAEIKAVERIQREVSSGHWAEAHRLAFEPMLNKMIREADAK